MARQVRVNGAPLNLTPVITGLLSIADWSQANVLDGVMLRVPPEWEALAETARLGTRDLEARLQRMKGVLIQESSSNVSRQMKRNKGFTSMESTSKARDKGNTETPTTKTEMIMANLFNDKCPRSSREHFEYLCFTPFSAPASTKSITTVVDYTRMLIDEDFFKFVTPQIRKQYLMDMVRVKNYRGLLRIGLMIPNYRSSVSASLGLRAYLTSQGAPLLSVYHTITSGAKSFFFEHLKPEGDGDFPVVRIHNTGLLYHDLEEPAQTGEPPRLEHLLTGRKVTSHADIFTALAASLHRQGLTKWDPTHLAIIMRLAAITNHDTNKLGGIEKMEGEVDAIVRASLKYDKMLKKVKGTMRAGRVIDRKVKLLDQTQVEMKVAGWWGLRGQRRTADVYTVEANEVELLYQS
eukprot:Blabericola_migrator_1__10@NODE_1003_length_5730_cov_34_006357_g690_i0_p2_GENE_NODE_1003_length_5730_cov_34_006357_g690_i0NODE_1003_length_5730_cov_34_006357_g690_i0_p2_ORF_typecomplete_len407_score70_06_NODE_1003_length_5730_cov_34_006357_g690_i033794599